MKELLDLLAHAERLVQVQRPFALATVVKIGGSTYRRPGARMLIDPDGRRWGTISGGCLEGEVAQQALEVIAHGTPRLMPFDLDDDDLVLGFGTGCNGIVHVLIEPVPAAGRTTPIDLLTRCIEARETGVMATVIAAGNRPTGLGQRLLLLSDGSAHGDLDDAAALYRRVRADAQHILHTEHAQAQPYSWTTHRYALGDGDVEVLFERVRPPIRLVLFGEGYDVAPVIGCARALGWRVAVVGRKPVETLADRFPDADEHLFLMHPDQVLDHVAFDRWSAALVMNHTYLRDRDLMHALLAATNVPYVGMLGPRERTERMVEEETLPEAELDRLYGPVGLDIGTETPEEIALSAVAEIQAVLHGRAGGSLRERTGPIHAARAVATLS